MTMTPEQKLKWAILEKAAEHEKKDPPVVTAENVDELYDALVDEDGHLDPKEEIRCSGEETGLPCQLSRHYESDAVAAKMPDGSWVGWTYWYGGGKHGEPEAIDWMDTAYFVDCKEEEKLMTVRTFAKPQNAEAGA